MKHFVVWAASLCFCASISAIECVPFIRGDANEDGQVTALDAIAIQDCLDNVSCPTRLDSCDWNDDGVIDQADVSAAWNFVYMQTPVPAAPYPGYGQDETQDWLDSCCGPFPAVPDTYTHSWKDANKTCNPFDLAWDIKTSAWIYPIQSEFWAGCSFHWEMFTNCNNTDRHCNFGEAGIGVTSTSFTVEQIKKEIVIPTLSVSYTYQISLDDPACYVPYSGQDVQRNEIHLVGAQHTVTLVDVNNPTRTWDLDIVWDFDSGVAYTASSDGSTIELIETWGQGQSGGGDLVAFLGDILLAVIDDFPDPPADCDEIRVSSWIMRTPGVTLRQERTEPSQQWSLDVSPKEQVDFIYYAGLISM